MPARAGVHSLAHAEHSQRRVRSSRRLRGLAEDRRPVGRPARWQQLAERLGKALPRQREPADNSWENCLAQGLHKPPSVTNHSENPMNTIKLASVLAMSALFLACADDGSDDYTAQTSSLRGRGGHDDAADAGSSSSADASDDHADAASSSADAGDDRHHVASPDASTGTVVGSTACSSDSQCGAGLECDDGRCKAHGGDDGDDDGSDDDAGVTSVTGSMAVACVTDSQCSAGLECDDGRCKAHGGGKGKN
ncbi:MAG: hypothetical protein RL385_315 [Pseudomonadota bacterium]